MWWFSFSTFDLPLDQIMFTQIEDLAKVILNLIVINLVICFNSIKLREASITLTSSYLKARKLFRFSMHESNAHIWVHLISKL